jgi:hypothetical protein
MAPKDTDTFNLYIRASTGLPDRYRVSAQRPDGPSEEVTFAVSSALSDRILKLHARGADRVLTTIPDQDIISSAIGEELFDTFFLGQVLSEYDGFFASHDTDYIQRIALHLPRSLYAIPWEVLRDPRRPPGSFLSRSHSLVRVDGELKGADPRYVRVPPTSPTLQLLFVLSSPADKPIADFDPAETGEVKFHRVDPATYSNFQAFTRKTDIRPDGFVFFGHGDIADNFGVLLFVQQRGRVFRTTVRDPRPGFTVAGDLADRDKIRLSCLLACESAWTSQKFPFTSSVVGAMLQGTNIPFVLGAQTPIDVFAAQEFLTGMVQALDQGNPLDIAITIGRRQVRSTVVGPFSALDWWVPVLYSRTISFNVVTEKPDLAIPSATRGF